MFFSPQRAQRYTESSAPCFSVFSVVNVFFTTEGTEVHREFCSVNLRVLSGELFFTTEGTEGHRGFCSVFLRVLRGEMIYIIQRTIPSFNLITLKFISNPTFIFASFM